MPDRKKVITQEWLYRRGFSTPEKRYMNPDGTATSRVFKLRAKDNGELSVDVKSMITPEKAVGDPTRYFLFELANEDVEKLELQSYHDSLPDGSNDAHAVIIGMTIDDEIKPGLLARKSKRVYL
ncbi:MAG TPA: hypothetical protein VMU83_18020 [Hanamia sp.]|nr:hypothetical protein [Hanamia sp.]